MEEYGKRILLRYEQSLLEEHNDNITNLAIIDDNGNVLFNENFNGKHLLKDSIGEINRIVQGAECIIDYHRNIYLLQRNGVNFKGIKKIDFAYDFAVMYGNWHSLNKSFACQPLAVCAKWFGFNFNFDNSALENVKIMLSCYQQLQKDIVRNNGYIIFDTCKNVPGMPTVIAYNRNAPEPFAVWTQTGKNDFYGGKYFSDYNKAMSCFLSDVRNKCYKIGKHSQNRTIHIVNKYDFDKEIAQINRTGDIDFFEIPLPTNIQEEIEDIAFKVKCACYFETVTFPLSEVVSEIDRVIVDAYVNKTLSKTTDDIILKNSVQTPIILVANHIRLNLEDTRYSNEIKLWADKQKRVPEFEDYNTYQRTIHKLKFHRTHPTVLQAFAEKLIEFSKTEEIMKLAGWTPMYPDKDNNDGTFKFYSDTEKSERIFNSSEEIKNFTDSFSEFKEISAKELDVLAQSDIPFETSKQQDGFIIKYNKVYSSQVNQILTQINCRR